MQLSPSTQLWKIVNVGEVSYKIIIEFHLKRSFRNQKSPDDILWLWKMWHGPVYYIQMLGHSVPQKRVEMIQCHEHSLSLSATIACIVSRFATKIHLQTKK